MKEGRSAEELEVIVYVGLGGNLDDPRRQVEQAFQELDEIPRARCLRCSGLYLSHAMGSVEQPDYVNAVAALATGLSAAELLSSLQGIETTHGRERTGIRWGPRPLDLDLLMYGDRSIDIPGLVVPHPGLSEREFVLFPLLEVAPPGLCVPGHGPLLDLVRSCPQRGIQRLPSQDSPPDAHARKRAKSSGQRSEP